MARLCLGTWAESELFTPSKFRGWTLCPKDFYLLNGTHSELIGSSLKVQRPIAVQFWSVAANVTAVCGFFFPHAKFTVKHRFGGDQTRG